MTLTNKPEIHVALCSVTATPDKKLNIDNATKFIHESIHRGAEWIFLPEMFSYHGPYDRLIENAEGEDGPLNELFRTIAQKHKVVIFAGSAPEKTVHSKKVYNTQYVFDQDGDLVAKYRKLHLFNLISSEGQKLYCESDGYESGNDYSVFDLEGWRVGLATCYDLRFPEMFRRMASKTPIDLFAIPAAFTLQTGTYHWHLLNRARAVENLCYVIAANQVGVHQPGKASFGHAVVIDPWGNIVADTGNRTGVVTAQISKEQIVHWRAQLPALSNCRTDLFQN
jgi:predicted amidohydrolase